MSYAEFAVADAYNSTSTGSAIQVLLINELDAGDVVIAQTTGIQAAEDYETIGVEEAGEEGVNEIAQGRHSGSASIPGFWRPGTNDDLPSRNSFIGKTYTIIEKIAAKRPSAGIILNVYVGCKINRYNQSFGARGLKTHDLGFLFQTRYNGEEWADLAPIT